MKDWFFAFLYYTLLVRIEYEKRCILNKTFL